MYRPNEAGVAGCGLHTGLAYTYAFRVDMRSGASLSSHHRRGISTQRVLDVHLIHSTWKPLNYWYIAM